MKLISLLFYQIGWLSAALIYHEPSLKEYGPEISSNKSSFGYSVTFLPDIHRLVVSAPKGNDVGALFTCEIDSRQCTQIPTDIDAPKKFHIWLGATVRAGSNFFATCAPRYFERRPKNGIFSRCYKYFTNNKKYPGLIRLKDKEISAKKFEYKMMSFGWSMDVDSNDNILVGGPAMYTGRTVKYEYKKEEIAKYPPLLIRFQNVKSNFGYSVVHRIYKNQKELAISSTYGEHGFGMVVLYNDKNGAIISKLRGKQVGSMFGASLCAASVDSEGQSVLLVGAPTYALDNSVNTGAVFIYKDNDTNTYREVLGKSSNGQFGYALANLGDLNGDKKDEIAISAPYEDDGHGVVYIFSGAHLMDRDKAAPWLQRIKGEKYHSFGLSLYALPDYDKNGCKELAIGIPQSNTTVLLNCLSTITVTVKELKPRGKLSNTTGFASFIFESCLNFQYPTLPKVIQANFSVKVDIPNLNIELSGRRSKDTLTYYTYVTPDNKEYCRNLTVSTPIDTPYEPTLHYQISAVLLEDPKNMVTFSPGRVTTSDLSVLTVPGTAWIGECENGNKCTPKLELIVNISISNTTSYIVGTTDDETVRISVKNGGDPAYGACIRVYLYGITLHRTPASCILPPSEDLESLICSPIKLLRNNMSWNIDDIKLDTKSIISEAEAEENKEFRVSVHLYDECNSRATIKMWHQNVTLHRDNENVTVVGLIKHDGIINLTRNEIEFSSKQIQHEYVIYNNGPTTWQNVRAVIHLQKEFFLDGISTISGLGYECTSYEDTDKEYISHCEISSLKKNQKFELVFPIDIMSKIYKTLKNNPLKVTSNLKISLGGYEKSGSVTTTLYFYEIRVPTWILVVAALFGLVIIVIIAFVLYECGFLRRKKKDDLRQLRNSVRRQSIRRSTVIQHRVKDSSDQEKLIEICEETLPDDEASTSTKVEVNEIPKKDNETDSKCKLSNTERHNELDNTKDEQNNQDNSIKTEQAKGKGNDPIAGIIIGGLRKNLRRRDVPPSAQE